MTRNRRTRKKNFQGLRAATPSEDEATGPRSVLPLSGRSPKRVTPVDVPQEDLTPAEEIRPPIGAPNVVIVLVDDVGFGATSAFGGPCETPALDRVGRSGLEYTRFHTTGLRAPTRQALLTGRNHHSAGMGCTTEVAAFAPGYRGLRPNTTATVAQILRMNGYSTSFFAKCEVPECGGKGARGFERGLSSAGFDKFYGFVAAERHRRPPTLFDGVTPIEAATHPPCDVTRELTREAIHWVKAQQTLTPDKPFFMYFAPGAPLGCIAPEHWLKRYRGRFDRGWDDTREETLTRQRELGVVPSSTLLSPRPEGVRRWETLSAEEKAAAVRLVESYAAYVSYADHHVGLLLDVLDELGAAENTLVFYVTGDGDASAEGALGGMLCDDPSRVGWAHAMCTPYQWTRQVASHWGGTRRAMAVRWPSGITANGELRHQFHHVVDLVPTILDAARLPCPVLVNGVAQKPIEGIGLTYSFDDAGAAERHTSHYFEMMGNGGIYHQGWAALTKHRTPWITGVTALPRFTEERWELYDSKSDESQCEDLARRMPGKLDELKQLWLIEAAKYRVVASDDRDTERRGPESPDSDTSFEDRPTPVISPLVRVPENASGDALSEGAGQGR
ncbi:MAG TPA: arylsulfatase [Polyangiaceae bacterium]|nr:arylsulfatase [Polyangiaceae bacterium]